MFHSSSVIVSGISALNFLKYMKVQKIKEYIDNFDKMDEYGTFSTKLIMDLKPKVNGRKLFNSLPGTRHSIDNEKLNY